jgi:hypothetical protein
MESHSQPNTQESAGVVRDEDIVTKRASTEELDSPETPSKAQNRQNQENYQNN